MQERGFVVHLPEERRYGLGIAAFELSSGFSRQQPLARLGRPSSRRLVDRLGESGHLAVLHGRDVLYLVEERAPRRPSLVTDVGRAPSCSPDGDRPGDARRAAARAAARAVSRPGRVRGAASRGRGGCRGMELRATEARARRRARPRLGRGGRGGHERPRVGGRRGRRPPRLAAAAIAVTFPDDAAIGLRERAVEGVREAAATLSRRIGGIR
jgi:hypothetical protein